MPICFENRSYQQTRVLGDGSSREFRYKFTGRPVLQIV